MTESNFGFSDSCTARTREDENLRKPQVKAAIEYRLHAREDARECRAVAFVILTHGAGCPGGMAATMRAAGFCRTYPPMSVCPGEVFDAGGGPLCDMDADVERGVVPRDDKYILRPVRLPVRMRCWGPSFRFLYGGLKVR